MNREIENEFRKREMDCNICFRMTRLYDLCESQSRKDRKCDDLQTEGVVYSMKCKKCEEKGQKKIYIGETGGKLEVRMKEHSYRNREEVKRTETYRHSENEHEAMNIKNWSIGGLGERGKSLIGS